MGKKRFEREVLLAKEEAKKLSIKERRRLSIKVENRLNIKANYRMSKAMFTKKQLADR